MGRFETLPRDEGVGDGLAARIHDPLWLLARQWQFGEFRGEDVGSHILEGPVIRIEIDSRKNVSGPMVFGQYSDAGIRIGGELAHVFVFIHNGAEEDRVFIDHFQDENLIVMAIVGGNARKLAFLALRGPFLDVFLRIFNL